MQLRIVIQEKLSTFIYNNVIILSLSFLPLTKNMERKKEKLQYTRWQIVIHPDFD